MADKIVLFDFLTAQVSSIYVGLLCPWRPQSGIATHDALYMRKNKNYIN
jgi:hypothetical protein